MRRLAKKNIHKGLYVALLLALAGLRLLIAHSQRVFLLPEQSGLDDMLMIRAAMRVSEGDWLGAYGGVTIAKNMGFALWLALLHTLRIPILMGNAMLWLAACAFATWALRPLLWGNLSRLLVFAFLLFQPISFAFFVQRVYRDAVFPALCLLFFAGLTGLVLRISSKKMIGSILCALFGGLGLTAAWLTREDGVTLLLFGACACLAITVWIIFDRQTQKRALKLVCVVLPFVILLMGITGFAAANANQYGVFLVNDLTYGEFPSAYGAMVAVSHAQSGYVRRTPVTQTALTALYKEVPSMAPLQQYLQSGGAFSGFTDAQTGEFGGSFYFAVRLAADYAGLTPTATTAQQYWLRVRGEIEQAVAQGRLQSITPSPTTVPVWDAALLVPTLRESVKGSLSILTFQDCNPRPAHSVGSLDGIETAAVYLHAPIQVGYMAGTAQPYYNPVQKACFLLCDILIWVYRLLVWPVLLLAIWRLLKGLAVHLKRMFAKREMPVELLYAILALGLLFSFALRVGIIAYMEVAAFGIGTYAMYYSGAVPPLLLFCVLALQMKKQEGAAAQAAQPETP